MLALDKEDLRAWLMEESRREHVYEEFILLF